MCNLVYIGFSTLDQKQTPKCPYSIKFDISSSVHQCMQSTSLVRSPVRQPFGSLDY